MPSATRRRKARIARRGAARCRLPRAGRPRRRPQPPRRVLSRRPAHRKTRPPRSSMRRWRLCDPLPSPRVHPRARATIARCSRRRSTRHGIDYATAALWPVAALERGAQAVAASAAYAAGGFKFARAQQAAGDVDASRVTMELLQPRWCILGGVCQTRRLPRTRRIQSLHRLKHCLHRRRRRRRRVRLSTYAARTRARFATSTARWPPLPPLQRPRAAPSSYSTICSTSARWRRSKQGARRYGRGNVLIAVVDAAPAAAAAAHARAPPTSPRAASRHCNSSGRRASSTFRRT